MTNATSSARAARTAKFLDDAAAAVRDERNARKALAKELRRQAKADRRAAAYLRLTAPSAINPEANLLSACLYIEDALRKEERAADVLGWAAVA
jgi:hypothetical protein